MSKKKKSNNNHKGYKCCKTCAEMDLSNVLDGIEDDKRVNKNDHHFVPIGEVGSNDYNPEEIFIAAESNGFDEDYDDLDDFDDEEEKLDKYEIVTSNNNDGQGGIYDYLEALPTFKGMGPRGYAVLN